MDTLLKWLEPPIHILMWVGVLAGFLMMVHVTADITGRAFYIGVLGTPEIVSGYYMIAVAYFPWALIARNDDHITVELFTRKLPPRIMEWLEIVMKIVTAVYVAVFTWETWATAVVQMGRNESLQVGGEFLAVWPSRYFLPVAGGLMVLYLVIRVLRDFKNAVKA
jgi:TRAP-type C4-dicarboxylate transport system permease small subunit